MTKTVTVDGKEVPLRASAAVPRLYRIKFRRDILVDMGEIKQALDEAEAARKAEGKSVEEASYLPMEALTLFENVAYIMAKHADKDSVPERVDDWLDSFDTFSIYSVFPVIQELWAQNLEQITAPQKK